jgi:hypothetical protein
MINKKCKKTPNEFVILPAGYGYKGPCFTFASRQWVLKCSDNGITAAIQNLKGMQYLDQTCHCCNRAWAYAVDAGNRHAFEVFEFMGVQDNLALVCGACFRKYFRSINVFCLLKNDIGLTLLRIIFTTRYGADRSNWPYDILGIKDTQIITQQQ